MEFASYLAGESWSDHPACTHPTLASLARMVNDCTTDKARARLTELIPSVIGLNGDNPRVTLLVALRAATAALPVANGERQRGLAVGILSCERQLLLTGGPEPGTDVMIRTAFSQAPDTLKWAHEFIESFGNWSRTKFSEREAESILRVAVQGVAEACIDNPDERLHDMLSGAIDDVKVALSPMEPVEPVEQPTTARQEPVQVLR